MMSTTAQIREEELTAGESELPEGWAETSLEVVGKWTTGGTPSRKVSAYFGGGIAWVKSGDLNDAYISKTEETISRSGLNHSGAKVLPPDSVCVALYGATIGKLGILRIEAATNQACASCQVDGQLTSSKFIFYYLFHQRDELISAGQGGAQPNLTNKIVREWRLLLPPLSEQVRIVSNLEQLKAQVDSARARLAKVPLLLKHFRQAVLAAACSGKLTEDWRKQNPEIEPAKKLLERIAVRRTKAKRSLRETGNLDQTYDLPPSWTWAIFDETCTDITVGHVGPMTHEYLANGVPFLRSQNVREFRFEPAGLKFISQSFHQRLLKSALHPGDVAVVRSGYPGVSCVIPNSLPEANCADLVVVRPTGALNSYYACIFINSSFAQRYVESEKVGIAQGHFNVGSMRTTPLPLPPLKEQEEIVRRVEALFELADAIEKRVAAATVRTEKLTQAILAKAFRGELVPTEAELARREGRDYEPASVLLERIKAERAEAESAAKPMPRRGKKANAVVAP